MIHLDATTCPQCKAELRHYDNVKRTIRTKSKKTQKISIRRFQCKNCKSLHRELPNHIFPYKQYESEVIIGVIEGLITPDTLGYEDYPCEMTMNRWISQRSYLHLLCCDKKHIIT